MRRACRPDVRARLTALLALVFACGVGADATDGAGIPTTDAGIAMDSGAPTDAAARSTLRVLFVGNSYTYVNDVPGLLTRIAETAPLGPRIVTESVVQGAATLENHLRNGIAQARIAEKTWTHVVLQGQSLEPVTPELFLTPAKTLADLVAAAGARPTWFVTWARAPEDSAYPTSFTSADELQDRLTSAYDEAARRSPGSMLACVGEAFRASQAAHPEIRLHQEDGSHATLAGSFLAATTLYVALTGSAVPDSSELPAGLDATQATTLRGVAQIGAQCSDVHIKAAVHLSGATGIDGPDGGPPYDFGVAGTSIPVVLFLTNKGGVPTALSDGHTLSAPFDWTGKSVSDAGTLPSCGATLAPGDTCQVSVTFSGKSGGTSRVTLLTSGAYQPSVTRSLTGAATDRALLTVSEWVDDECLRCQPLYLSGYDRFTFVVMNRGGSATTSIAAGDAPASPLAWDGTGFPGGTGNGESSFPPTVTLPFCGSVLAPGERCLVRIHIDRPAAGGGGGGGGGGQVPFVDAGPPLERAVTLRYADAKGEITTFAARAIELR